MCLQVPINSDILFVQLDFYLNIISVIFKRNLKLHRQALFFISAAKIFQLFWYPVSLFKYSIDYTL